MNTASANAAPHGLSPPDGPAIDLATLDRLRELDPDGQAGIVLRVLRTYDAALSNALASLASALGGEQAAELRRLAHTLKSSSASVGALGLSALCGETERLAREGWLPDLVPMTHRLIDEGRRVQSELRNLLPGAA